MLKRVAIRRGTEPRFYFTDRPVATKKKTSRRESPNPCPPSHIRSRQTGCCKMLQSRLFAAVFCHDSSSDRSQPGGGAIRVPIRRRLAATNEKRRGRSRRTDPASHGGTLFISVSLACRSRVPDTTNHSPTLRRPNRRLQRKGKVFRQGPASRTDMTTVADVPPVTVVRPPAGALDPCGRERHRPPAQIFSGNPVKIPPRPPNHLSHQANHPIEKGTRDDP